MLDAHAYAMQVKLCKANTRGVTAYKLQLPPEMSTIFDVFHVSQLKKLQSDLTYEEKPIRVLEEMERVTRSKIIKFYKVVWNNHSEQDATWEREDYLREVYPTLFQEW